MFHAVPTEMHDVEKYYTYTGADGRQMHLYEGPCNGIPTQWVTTSKWDGKICVQLVNGEMAYSDSHNEPILVYEPDEAGWRSEFPLSNIPQQPEPVPILPTTPAPTVFDTAYWTPLYPQPFSAADLEAGDVGKWLLFWKDPAVLERKWAEAQRAFDDGLLPGVTRMKMSTSGNSGGVLVLYCDRSSDRDHIMAVGDVILWAFRYDESEYIFYKTDAQTATGTHATGQVTNHSYKSNQNPHYRPALVDQACEDCGVAMRVEA